MQRWFDSPYRTVQLRRGKSKQVLVTRNKKKLHITRRWGKKNTTSSYEEMSLNATFNGDISGIDNTLIRFLGNK